MSGPRAVVVAYRADWPDRAAAVASALEASLGPGAVRVEHIGSTSIPGMAAKDLLDMQVSVADLVAADATFGPPLASLGFERFGQESDHMPAGLDDDPANWAKRLWLRRGHPEGAVNLHVRRTGSPNERLALLFRDWFRAHPEAVPAYAAFKMALAGATDDLDAYTDTKDPVVDLVVVVAEEWARQTSWIP